MNRLPWLKSGSIHGTQSLAAVFFLILPTSKQSSSCRVAVERVGKREGWIPLFPARAGERCRRRSIRNTFASSSFSSTVWRMGVRSRRVERSVVDSFVYVFLPPPLSQSFRLPVSRENPVRAQLVRSTRSSLRIMASFLSCYILLP